LPRLASPPPLLDFEGEGGHKRRPMAVQVKICGLTSADAADAAVRAGADLAGLVFCPGSPRHLAVAQGAALATRLRGRTRIVALLVDPQDDEVASAIAAVNPDFLQLHGRETPDRVARLRTRFGRLVIKAMPVAEAPRRHRAQAARAGTAPPLTGSCSAGGLSSGPGCWPAGSIPKTSPVPFALSRHPAWMSRRAWKNRPA